MTDKPFACTSCGESLVREGETIKEIASGEEHKCWQQLPELAEHLRIEDG